MLDQSPFPLTNALHELPPLVLELVLAQLAEHDLGRLACTSRTLRAAVDQDVTWRHVYHTAHADSQELLNSAAALTAAGRSWRQVVLYAAPSITAVVGGLGGSSFDTANFAYSRDLMGCRVRGNQQTSLPSWSSPCPALAAPCLSPRTCRVLACVRLWVSVQARDPPHIRAMQLRYHNPANPAIGTWTHRIGAHDEDGQRPSEATHTLELAEGEHITCVRCFEGWCCWAGNVLLGIVFSTNRNRSCSYGNCDANSQPVRKVSEFRFPHRMLCIWGRRGYVIDQIGFDFL